MASQQVVYGVTRQFQAVWFRSICVQNIFDMFSCRRFLLYIEGKISRGSMEPPYERGGRLSAAIALFA